MARRRGTFTLSSNIELEAGAPLDSRDIVQNKEDLTNGSFPYSYVGMETYVRSEGKKYRLIGDDPTVLSNWVEVGSGSGSEAELVEISEEDYAALTTEEKNDPTKVYFRYEANGFFKSVQDDPEATAFEGEKLATGRTIESVVDGKLEGKLDLTGGTMTGDLLTDTQTDIHAQRNLYLGNNGTSEESEGRSQLHFRRKGGGTNGITTLAPLQSKEIDDSYDENHYTQHLQCKSGTIALLEDVNKKADSTTVEGSTSVSGNPIAISDAANAYAEEVIANIEPIQDLHGYDHPWVGGAGKNLIPMTVDGIKAANTAGTWAGNTYTYSGVAFTINTDSDGNVISILLNGTNSGAVMFFHLTDDFSLNGEYILGGYDSALGYGYIDTTMGSFVSGSTTHTSKSYNGSDLGYAYLRVPQNAIISNKIITPLCYTKSDYESDPTFEPYSNICPISGLDSVEVKRVGKNLFDSDTLLNANGWTKDTDGVYSGDNRKFYLAFRNGLYMFNGIDMTNVQVTFSLDSYGTYNGRNIYIGFYYTDGTFENIALNTTSWSHYSFTSNANKIIDFVYGSYSQEGTSYIKNFQIEFGSSVTEYEPYLGETHTTSLPQTVYGGTLNVQTGELVVDRASVDLGTLDWSQEGTSQSSTYFRFIGSLPQIGIQADTAHKTAICSHYSLVAEGATYSRVEGFTINTRGIEAIFYVDDYKTYTAAQFKTAMNGVQLVYELATPQTYQLTPSQVKFLLNHNNISTNADTLDLTYQVNNVLGEILSEAEGYTDIYVQKRLSVVERELYCQDGYYGIEWNIDNLMELVRAKRFMDFATGDFVVDNDVIWEITQKMPYSYYNLKDSNKANLSPHISLCPREIIGTQQYNTTNTNTGGYGGSLMPARMETEYEKLGTELKSYVATIRHLDNNKGTWAWTERQMFLPSIVELTGNKGFADGYSGFASSQHKLFAGGGMHRIKYSWYWTADPSGANTISFCFLSSYGASNYSYASDAGGLAPLIVLK